MLGTILFFLAFPIPVVGVAIPAIPISPIAIPPVAVPIGTGCLGKGVEHISQNGHLGIVQHREGFHNPGSCDCVIPHHQQGCVRVLR